MEPYGIYVGLGIGVLGGVLISNVQGYYMVKKELIEGYLTKGREYTKNYAEQIDKTFYRSRLSRILNRGPQLACERFESEKFGTIINNLISKHRRVK